MKKKYYVVVKGRTPGVYTKWFGTGQAEEQVKEFPDPIYKGFYTHEEALNWLAGFSPDTLQTYAPNLLEYLQETPRSATLAESVTDLLQAGKVVIFTDGGADTGTGLGGYGVVLKYKEHVKELSGGFSRTTSNRMELMACIQGLRALKRRSDVVIFSDSRYVVDSMSKGRALRWQAQGWMRNDKERAKNADLWAQLLELCAQHNVEFRWVKGHNSTPENERCDRLARAAMQKSNLPHDDRGKPNILAPLFTSQDS